MNRFLHKLRCSAKNALVLTGRARARTELLRLNDRRLLDAGFSRELLESGVAAWPWRSDADTADHRAVDPQAVARQAERELRQLSDADLDDLAIARADIPRAVREGRVGFELPAPATADWREAA